MTRGFCGATLVVLAFSIVAHTSTTTDSVVQRRPNFAEEVAPIVHAHCTTCHRPGDSAPFALLSYDDVRARGREIADAVKSRRMPPWLPVAASGYPSLHGDRRLQARQIETLVSWVDAGMPPGDLKRAPWPPTFPMGWQLGVPNLTMTLPRPMSIPASSHDLTFNVLLHLAFPEDRWITALDYRPSSTAAISHARFFAASSALVIGEEDALPGFAGLLGPNPPETIADELARVDSQLTPLGVWASTAPARAAPAGTAIHLPKNTNIVMQVVARASDTGAIEDGQVALYFTTARQTTPLTSIAVPSSLGIAAGIDLPAGDARAIVRDALTLPIDVMAFGARGHAHNLGRDLKFTARLPNGSVRGLLWIDRWDPKWQDTFYFTSPIRLPKGTTVHVEMTYDNSAGNPRQRSDPPRRVSWGSQLSAEVGSMELVIALPPAADTAALAAARAAHFRRQLLKPAK
jgi:hypothetical protein